MVRSDASVKRTDHSVLLLEAMASCTAVTVVNGRLVGDPLDVQMFQATGWILDENEEDSNGFDTVCIARVYPEAV